MRRSITKKEVDNYSILLKRVLYRYSGECVKGTVLCVVDGGCLCVELDNNEMIERHYTSWEILE